MKWLRGVIAAAVLVLVAAPALGQIPDNHNIQFKYSNWGSYWGPYTLQVLDPSSYPNPTALPGTNYIDAFCVDYTHHVWTNVTWEAVYTPLTDLNGLRANTRYGQLMNNGSWLWGLEDLQLQYQRSAWLASQFTPDNGLALHNAIWHLWTPTQPNTLNHAPWLGMAMSIEQFKPDDFSDWYVVTDVAGNRQEFLTRVNVVPEPATLILMGTGLVAVMGMTIVMRQSLG